MNGETVVALAWGAVLVRLVGVPVVSADAAEHSSRPAAAWAVVVLVAGLVGLVAYAVVGRDAAGEPTAPRPEGASRNR